MKKPNILILAQLPPPVHGASTINKIIVDSKLINESFNLVLLPLSFVKSVDDIGKASFIKIVYLVRVVFNLIKALLIKKTDLVYFTLSPTGFAFYRDIILVTILKIFKKKIVYHLHGKGIKDRVLNSKLDKQLYTFVFNKTNVIVLSESLIDDIDLIYFGKPYVLNNGISSQEIKRIEETSEDPVTFVFLSNLVLSKGIKTFLEATKIVYNNGYKFEAKIIGNSVDYSIDEAQAFVRGNNLSKVVHILGPKYGAEKFVELASSDVFVFPTENDCFPLSLLEAMQMRLPIISTGNGAIPDIVEHNINGFIVEEGDAKQVSDAMSKYLEDKTLIYKHGTNNLEKFRSNYTQQLFEKNFVIVIQSVLSDFQWE